MVRSSSIALRSGRRKRVVILSYLDYPYPAGLAKRIRGIVESLDNAGFLPCVICPTFRYANAPEAPHVTRFDLRLLHALGAERLLTKIIALVAFNLVAFVKVFVWRRELLAVQSESVYSLPAGFLAKIFLGCPLVVDDILISGSSFFASSLRFLAGALSDLALSSTKPKKFGTEHVLYMPTGIDSRFSYERLSLNFDMVNVVFVGALSYPANLLAVKHLVRATSLLSAESHCKILLVGGPIPASVPPNLSLSFLGTLDDDSLRRVYRESNVGVLPFFGIPAEGPKVKVLDYMAAGLLVVSSPEGVQGYPELVPDRHYVSVGSTVELVQALDKIRGSQEAYAEIAKRAHAYVMSHYDWSDLLRPYVAFLENLAHRAMGNLAKA